MRLAIVALLALSACSTAAAQDIGVGRALVVDYCSTCHSIERAGDSPHPQAPPFRDLHLRYDVGEIEEGLVEGLVSGHPDMPEFEFDPDQAAAIVAYIRSLTP